ncbi:MAG: type II toxin-antitoxin system prevent-host-death family antitoxin [Candidatus Aminicenantes bacterium]|nr:type II toxin-antitoxin system prevent-host-death family antitoxin [Candidatus Aminicenantes bacterium]
MRFVNVRELKSKTSEILRAAAGEDIVVTNHGKPVAVVTGIDAGDLERIGRGGGAGRVAEGPPVWHTSAHDSDAGLPHPAPSPFPPSEGRIEIDPASGARRRPDWNPLKAVFWDYPNLTEERALKAFLAEAKANPESGSLDWAMTRLLERGRVVDVKKLFDWSEIRMALTRVRLSPWARAKWNRMLEVYDHA